jgi:hypothetical protein
MSLMGCVYGCSRYFGLGNTDTWLYGACGFSSVINIHKELCPSGPTAWKTGKSLGLLANCGLSATGIIAWDSQPDYPQKYLEATNIIRNAVENGRPAVVFWANKAEYYLVRGINDDGIFISGFGSEEVPFKPWTKIPEWHMMEALAFEPTQKVDDAKTVRDGLKLAIDAWNGDQSLYLEGYDGGAKAFDAWIASFDNPKINGFGLAYNSQVWAETRMMAVDFFREASTKLGLKKEFAKAIECAIVSAECLKMVATQFPFVEQDESHKSDPARIETARTALSTAKNVEGQMVSELEKLVKTI